MPQFPKFRTISGLVPAMAALAVLGGCATAISPVEVTRFHTPAIVQSGGFVIEPATEESAVSLEYRTYATAVSQELQRIGFTDEAGLKTFAASEYIVRIGFSRDVRSPATAQRSPVSVGVGGATGSYGSGLGVGIGINLSGKPKDIVTTGLTVQIRRRSDNSAIWEGRAVTMAKENAPAAQPSIAAAKLASALFKDYPGKSGETIEVK